LKKFEIEDCKEVATPTLTNCYLDLDGKGITMDQTKDRRLTRSLLYLTVNRLDIMFSMCMCVRY